MSIRPGHRRWQGIFLAGLLAAIVPVQAQFIWNSGGIVDVIGGTTIGISETLTIATATSKDFDSLAVLNEGTVSWSGGALRSGNGGTFTNAAGAFFNDLNTANNHIQNVFGGSFSFTNAGTYAKSGTGTTFISVPFHNTGAVNVATGILKLEGGGTTSAAGVINTSAGATTTFNASYTVDNAASLTGTGTFALEGGTLTLNGTTSVSPFNQTGGILAGTHTFAGVNFNWSAGNWSSVGTTTFDDQSTVNLTGITSKDFNLRTVINEGTFNWSGGALRSGTGGSFTNAAGALFNDLNTATNHIQNVFGGSFSFTNAGTYAKSGTGTTIISVPFHNTGTVNVTAGTFRLEGGGATSAVGVINTAVGATTNFTASYTVDDAASLTGAGTYALTAGTLTLTGTASVSPFNQNGGILAGTHTFAGVDFNWSAGNWSSAGTTTFDSQSTVNLTGATSKDFNLRTVINEGTFNWSGGALRSGTGGTFTNAAGALFNDLNTATNHIQNVFGGSFSFTNAGTYDKSGTGTTFISVPFINSGLLDINLGTLSLSSALTLQPGSLLSFGLTGPNAGLDHGELSMSGVLVLDGMLQFQITAGFASSTAPTDTFTLISTGGLSGSFSNITSGNRLFSYDGLGSFAVHYGAGSSFGINDVVLTDFIPVPEPSTWALLITGLGLMIFTLRRRRA